MTRFKECRLLSGLSQKYVAVELGVKQPTVFAYESGKANPSNDKLLKMAKLYGVTPEYLLGIDEVEKASTMPIAEIQQATVPDREIQIKRMEHYDQMNSLLSGLTPENKEKALAYIKYLEFTQE